MHQNLSPHAEKPKTAQTALRKIGSEHYGRLFLINDSTLNHADCELSKLTLLETRTQIEQSQEPVLRATPLHEHANAKPPLGAMYSLK